MPHNFDFSKLKDVKTVEINPEGWINPITIEYAIGLDGDTPSCFWRVKGTKHTFVIPYLRLSFLSGGEYAKHFKEALEGFRKDYLEWKRQDFFTDWMQEYRDQYSKYILL